MRKIIYALACLFVTPAWGLASTKPVSYLNATETQALVQAIDTICGDTWCAGDLNYRFDQLVCNTSECYFDIQALTRNDNGASQSRPYRCQLKGFQAASDLLKVDTSADGQTLYRYTDKLYDAMSQCINEEIPGRYPVVYLPKASTCRDSLRQQPRFKSAAHSVYAEVFHELENKAQASAKVLNQMVEQYGALDSNCSLQYHMVFEDEISCERVNGVSVICSLPTDLGRFVVIKDYVDSAAVIYVESTRQTPSLGTLLANSVTAKLAQPEACYTELLNLDSKQAAQKPFDSSDHHTYFVSAKSLNPKQDARKNAAQLINRAVDGVKKTASTCQTKVADVTLSKEACTTLGGIPTCVLSGPNAGYYVVTKDASDGAFVTFIRFD